MSDTTDCPICFEKIEDTTSNSVSTNCGHRFHCTCFVLLFKNRCNDEIKCPICRVELLPSKSDDRSVSSSESSDDAHHVFSPHVSSRNPHNQKLSIIVSARRFEEFKTTYQQTLHANCEINRMPLLQLLLIEGKTEFVEHIIQVDNENEDSCVTKHNDDGENALFWAVKYPNIVKSIVEIFKKRGIDINTQDDENCTALTKACHEFRSLNWKRDRIKSKENYDDLTEKLGLLKHTANPTDTNKLMFEIMKSSNLFQTLKEHLDNVDSSDIDENNIDYEDKDSDIKDDTNNENNDMNTNIESDSDEDFDDDDTDLESLSFSTNNVQKLSTLEEVYNAEIELFETVKILIENGANVNVNEGTEQDGVPPLSEACGGGFLDVIKLLIEKGARINNIDDEGMSALMRACYEESEDIVRYLLTIKDIDLELTDSHGCTALWKTVCWENVNIAEILLDAGANVNTSTSRDKFQYRSDNSHEDYTVFMKAVETSSCEMVQLLIDRGADTTVQMKIGGKKTDYLCEPVKAQHVDMVKILLENNIGNINQRSGYDKMTPLMIAVNHHNLNMTKILISHGARTDQKNRDGENLIDILNHRTSGLKCLDSEKKEDILKLISK